MRWVIGILVVVVLVILGYQYFGGAEVDVADQPEVADEADVDVAEPAEEAAQETEQAAEEAAQATEEAAEETAAATEEAADEAAQATEETAEETAAATEEAGEEAAETTGEVAGETEEATETLSAEVTEEAEQLAEEARETTGEVEQEVEQATETLSEEVTEEAEDVTAEVAEATGTEEAAGAAQEMPAVDTAALVVGDVNVGEQLTGVVQNTEETLQGITDQQSAEAAVPALNDINARLEELSGSVDQLPEDAKKVLADLLSQQVAELKTLADDVTAQEGVEEVVSPALEPIIAKLEDWSQAPA